MVEPHKAITDKTQELTNFCLPHLLQSAEKYKLNLNFNKI